jgi:hypothetical protein
VRGHGLHLCRPLCGLTIPKPDSFLGLREQARSTLGYVLTRASRVLFTCASRHVVNQMVSL